MDNFYFLRIFTVLLLIGAALAQSACPASLATCDAAYTTPGGTTDCCKHNYDAEALCGWSSEFYSGCTSHLYAVRTLRHTLLLLSPHTGTPITFRRVRTCGEAGKVYTVLSKGNFQGPPDARVECRCMNTVAPSAAAAAAPSLPSTVQVWKWHAAQAQRIS